MASPSTPSLFRAFRPGVPLRSETKQVILNVYASLRKIHPHESISFILNMCAEYTGVSKRTVENFKADSKKNASKPTSPLRSMKTVPPRRLQLEDKHDSLTFSAIRQKVHHEFFAKNQHVTVEKVLKSVNADETLPNFCWETMRKVLKMTGFVFRPRKRNSAMIDRKDIITWRKRYLQDIKKVRASGRPIVYLDETWVNAGHHKDSVWQDSTVTSSQQAFLDGLTCGPKAPSGKGSRLIVTHAGTKDGFIEGALDVFEGKKSGDYHEEMDGNHFETWFENKLLPNLQPGSVIVMDNASYHSVRLEKIPTKGTKKAHIQAWLTSKGVAWESKMIVRQLLKLVESVRQNYNGYRIDEMAKKHGHTVLRLPPYHCELNPIELAWAQVKDYVAKNNTTFKLKDVKQLLLDGIARVTAKNWSNDVDHVIKEEIRMADIDGLMDHELESFVIQLGSEDSDDSADESVDDIEEME